MNTVWVQIRSWHAIDFVADNGAAKALCGKWAASGAPQSDAMPSGKSCESCLRKMAKRSDA